MGSPTRCHTIRNHTQRRDHFAPLNPGVTRVNMRDRKSNTSNPVLLRSHKTQQIWRALGRPTRCRQFSNQARRRDYVAPLNPDAALVNSYDSRSNTSNPILLPSYETVLPPGQLSSDWLPRQINREIQLVCESYFSKIAGAGDAAT